MLGRERVLVAAAALGALVATGVTAAAIAQPPTAAPAANTVEDGQLLFKDRP